MGKSIPFLILLITHILSADDPIISSITLEDHLKVVSTFSGEMSENNSFHLIVAKNKDTKQYDLIPVKHSNGDLQKLDYISFEVAPEILSFHSSGSLVSLFVSVKVKKERVFFVVDIDYSSGQSNISNRIYSDDFITVLRKKDKSLALFISDEEIRVFKIENSKEIKVIKVRPKNDLEYLKELSKGFIDPVNSDEFVTNGSLSNKRAYCFNEDLLISVENVIEGKTTVVKIPLYDELFEHLNINVYRDSKLKKSTSYIVDNKLFQLKTDKENGVVNIYDINSDDKSKIDLSNSFIANKSSDFESVEKFLRSASKNNNEPTISVNKTTDKKLVLRIDFVNKLTYLYNSNWWWHHMQFQQDFMRFQNQQMMNSIPSFGPYSDIDFDDFIKEDTDHFFEILIDEENNVLNETKYTTIHKDIDRSGYIDRIEGLKALDYASSVFLNNTFRCFVFEKTSGTFMIFDKDYND